MRRVKSKEKVTEPLLEMGENGAYSTPAAKSKDEWVGDGERSNCQGCEKSFTLKRRKHHCRHCGGLFCNDCCSTKFKRNLTSSADSDKTKAVRVCNLCWHSLELMADGPLDPESPLALATSDDEGQQPQGQVLALVAVAKHGTHEAQSALSRKLTERLMEPHIPVKLKALRLVHVLSEESSSHFQSLLKHDATPAVRTLTRFTVAPDPELGDKPATACRNASMTALETLEALPDTRAVIGRDKVPQRTDANSMKTAMRIAKRRAGTEWGTYSAEEKRLAIENVGEESPRGPADGTAAAQRSPAGDRRSPPTRRGTAKVVGSADVGALLGEDSGSSGSSSSVTGGRGARAVEVSRPASPNGSGGNASGSGFGKRPKPGPDSSSSWSPEQAQQQTQAQRLDYNQEEIERRDSEIANIESTVNDIQEIFADLAVVVENQDEQVEALEGNVAEVVKSVGDAGEELMSAEKYQKQSRKCKLMLFAAIIVGMVLVIWRIFK